MRVLERRISAAFTLVEMLVAITVLLLLMAMIGAVINQVSLTMRNATAELDTFQNARQAFNSVAETLSQATLNTYWDYDNPNSPGNYIRKSDLRFLILGPSALQPLMPASDTSKVSSSGVFFEAPRAYSSNGTYSQTTGLLNAIGYYIEYGDDNSFRPPIVTAPRYRYRLMQALQPTESFQVFADAASGSNSWVTNVVSTEAPIAENVIAMIIWPKTSILDDTSGNGTELTTNYTYDSGGTTTLPQGIQQAQLPPIVQLTLVAISESTALRLNPGPTQPAVIANALNNKFTNVQMYAQDLASLETSLQQAHIDYKVLNTMIPIRESKWSGVQ